MNLAIDLNTIVQAVLVAALLASFRTLWKTAARLDTHEQLDDLRFQYIEEKLEKHEERISKVA